MNQCNANSYGKIFYEIAYDSNTYWIEYNKLDIDTNYVSDLENCTKERIYKIRNLGIYYSGLLSKQLLLEALSFIKKSIPKGIVIYNWEINDESQYTDGTGLSITFLNPTKKTIKYIWISAIGYNAVNDKVMDPLTRTTTNTVKCIGPIAGNEFGSYNFEYFWYTDIIHTAKITQIKIQYMDGTTKIVSNPMEVILPKNYHELFE